MQARRLLALVVALVGLAAAAVAASATAPALPVVRLNGVGPLRLGMTQAAAVATGWLAARGTGCELAGPPLPVTYKLVGPKAPAGVDGVAEFDHGKLAGISFTGGVRTAVGGVVPGRTTVAAMVAGFRKAGFRATAKYDSTFAGTFVTVSRFGSQRLGGFAEKQVVTTVGIPYVPVCE